MTFKECKHLFEDRKKWQEINSTQMVDHVKWTRFVIFGEVFMALSVLTGYDDYRPGIGFVPAEKMRLKQLYRVDQEGRLREVSKTEALEIIKEAKRRFER